MNRFGFHQNFLCPPHETAQGKIFFVASSLLMLPLSQKAKERETT